MSAGRALLVIALAAATCAVAPAGSQETRPLSSRNQQLLKSLDDQLAAGDAAAVAAALEQLQPKLDADERLALDTIYVLLGRRHVAEAKVLWNGLAPRLQQGLASSRPGAAAERARQRRAAEAMFVQGLLGCRADSKASAMRDLEQADGYGFPPLDSPLIVLAANCLVELQEPTLAAQAYRAFLERSPGDVEARMRLGAALLLSGQVGAAEPELARALEKAPQSPQASYWMGALRFEQKRYDEAKTRLEQALKLEPRCIDCMAQLAHIAYLSGDDRLCESFLKKAEALDPAHVETNLVAGMLANRAGQYQSAIEHLTRVVERAPNSARAQHQLALAYRRSGNAEQAGEHQAIYERLLKEQQQASLGERGSE